MCGFSRTVQSVADTNILAQASRDGRQFLAYAVTFRAAETGTSTAARCAGRSRTAT